MATTIKSTRVVKTYEYKSNDYNISGDFVVSELGNVVSVSGNITKDDAQVGTFNAYDYNDSGELKVNVNGVDFDSLVDVVEACNQFVGEIKPQVEADSSMDDTDSSFPEPSKDEPSVEEPLNDDVTNEEPEETTIEEPEETEE